MTLDDLAERRKKQAEERLEEEERKEKMEEVKEIAEELGIEDKKDLEELDRLMDIVAGAVSELGHRVDRLEEDLIVTKRALTAALEKLSEEED